MKSRLLSLLLAALLCAGLFSVIPASAASGQIAYWDAADLAAAATQTGADNGAGGPIFTTENQAIGVQLMTDGYRVAAGGFAIPIYDAEGNELIYEGDTIRFEAYLWVEEEELEAGAHAARIRMLWPDSDMQAYNDKIGPTQPNMDTLIVSRDNFRALETMYDDTYGDYKIVSMEHTFTGEDFERLGDAAYIPVAIAGQGAFYKLFYMAAYNVDAGDILFVDIFPEFSRGFLVYPVRHHHRRMAVIAPGRGRGGPGHDLRAAVGAVILLQRLRSRGSRVGRLLRPAVPAFLRAGPGFPSLPPGFLLPAFALAKQLLLRIGIAAGGADQPPLLRVEFQVPSAGRAFK